ncbi:MAG: transcription factor S [Candidatus Aenigmarchaeota archaeon]|nr:transcription factor S [Candidatus Aenigmarchaeota archaeon]
MMKLCEKCGSLMAPVKKDGGVVLVCNKCGKQDSVEKGKVFKLKEKMTHEPFDSIPVVDGTRQTLPVTSIECPECGHNKAGWWTQQTRSSDEPETRFYRCIKCKKTWREYS